MSKAFYEFLLENFTDDSRVQLMRVADKYKVEIKEALEIIIKDASRDNSIILSNLTRFQIKLIKKHTKKRLSETKFVENLVHELFTSLKNEGSIPDSKKISKADLRRI